MQTNHHRNVSRIKMRATRLDWWLIGLLSHRSDLNLILSCCKLQTWSNPWQSTAHLKFNEFHLSTSNECKSSVNFDALASVSFSSSFFSSLFFCLQRNCYAIIIPADRVWCSCEHSTSRPIHTAEHLIGWLMDNDCWFSTTTRTTAPITLWFTLRSIRQVGVGFSGITLESTGNTFSSMITLNTWTNG